MTRRTDKNRKLPELIGDANAKALQHPEEKVREAKRLFMANVPVVKIAEQLDLPVTTVNNWKKRAKPVSWDIEREDLIRGLIDDTYAAGRPLKAEIQNMTLEQIKRGVMHVMTREDPPSLQEMEKLTIIYTNLDKVSRLEKGESTENLSITGSVSSTKQAIEILMNDPFKPKDELIIDAETVDD
jgi:hypothetical protein